MGECAANGPVKWESCCWLVLKVSRYSCRLTVSDYQILQILGMPESHQWGFFENFVGCAVVAKDPEVP